MDWAIIGGESGNLKRESDGCPEWAVRPAGQPVHEARSVPCFVKQMGTQWAKHAQGSKRLERRNDFGEFPEALQVREYPSIGEQ